MRTAIDTSVLILLQSKQPGWERWRDCLSAAAAEGEMLVSPIVFAEFSVAYRSLESAQADLDRLHIIYDPIQPATAYLAGRIFLAYRREGGPRQQLIPDFIVGAHATAQADRLAAMDRGYLRRYFPKLKLLAPSAD